MIKFGNDWDSILDAEFQKEYYLKLREFLKAEYFSKVIYPPMGDIFNALKYTAYSDVKVLLLGQDPYHGASQAHGLAFSVQRGIDTPPSLKNIYKELQADLGCYIPNNGCLLKWAEQGVLLLNTSLTVQGGLANSHRKKGWEIFTDKVILCLNEREKPVIFLLWGNNAREKKLLITNPQHYVLEAPHPSPLSAHAGFFGCRHFSKVNEILRGNGALAIDWQIENN